MTEELCTFETLRLALMKSPVLLETLSFGENPLGHYLRI